MQLAKGDTDQWNQVENSRNKPIQLWHANFGYRCKYNSIEKKIVLLINRAGKQDISKQNKSTWLYITSKFHPMLIVKCKTKLQKKKIFVNQDMMGWKILKEASLS